MSTAQQTHADIEVEQALLGSILVNSVAFARVSGFLSASDFANPVHGRIYAAIGTLIGSGAPVDAVTVRHALGDDPVLVPLGGTAAYVVGLIKAAVTVVNAEHYGKLIVEMARRRALVDIAKEISDKAIAGAPLGEIMPQALAALRELGDGAGLNRLDPDAGARLTEALDIATWSALDIPPEPKLLGDLVTPTTRVFIVGRSGLGKTLLLQGACAGMARGTGFCHWRSERASRWLIIDGEMPTVLTKQRSEDVIRRGGPIPPGNLTIYSLDRAEEFERMFPGLGMLAPLNTEEGQRFVLQLVELVKPEGVAFDNVMSLVPGDQKDEVPWSGALPLVAELTRRRISQIFLDHTGHNSDRQYGSSTKQWRMDAVGMMTPLGSDQTREPGEAAFNLSFDPPAGKARRQTPDNQSDFANVVIRLSQDQWTSEPATGADAAGRLSPKSRLWHLALLDALTRSPQPNRTTRTEWFGEAVRTGLAEAFHPKDSWRDRDRKTREHRKFISELRAKGFIGVDGETVHYLRGCDQ